MRNKGIIFFKHGNDGIRHKEKCTPMLVRETYLEDTQRPIRPPLDRS